MARVTSPTNYLDCTGQMAGMLLRLKLFSIGLPLMESPFPLPLTPLERFFSLDDRPDFPNQIVCRLSVTGQVDQDKFRKAAIQWVEMHPMLTAKLEKRGTTRVWVAGPFKSPEIRWLEESDEANSHHVSEHGVHRQPFPDLAIPNLSNGKSTHLTVRQWPQRADIILQTHHAAVDGIGGLHALHDLLLMYAMQFDDFKATRLPKLRRCDAERLRQRGDYLRGVVQRIRRLPISCLGGFGVLKYLSRRAAPILWPEAEAFDAQTNPDSQAVQEQPHAPSYRPEVISTRLPASETNQLKQVADHADVTVNGLLVRDLYVAIRDWQNQAKIERKQKYLRIMIPINMRTIGDRRLSACNRVSMVYLDRSIEQMQRLQELLWGINFEIKTIQRFNLGLTCLTMMKVMGLLPGVMRRNIVKPVCRSTCILTNLGDPFARMAKAVDGQGRLHIGDLAIESFDLLAPIRPLTGAAISLSRYSGQTIISMHYDRKMLTGDQAESLLVRYSNQIKHTINRHQRAQNSSGADSQPSPTKAPDQPAAN